MRKNKSLIFPIIKTTKKPLYKTEPWYFKFVLSTEHSAYFDNNHCKGHNDEQKTDHERMIADDGIEYND